MIRLLIASSIFNLILNGCAGGFTTLNVNAIACTSTADDSSFDGINVLNIQSQNFPNTYKTIAVRNTTIDYMVHDSANPKALLILIAGGQLNANISGVEGQPATHAGDNFLVRSAHLFAAQAYKVVTVDRPGDYADFIIPAGSTSGSAFDSYRTSTEHANDLQAIITAENSATLPVVIAGTSRGAISAVAQHNLGDLLLLSAPVTSGGNGSPVGSIAANPVEVGTTPVQIIWHKNDDCFVSAPADANAIASDFTNATAVQVTGGINHPELSNRISNPGCDGSKTFHGFVGIESCVVRSTTDWLAVQLK